MANSNTGARRPQRRPGRPIKQDREKRSEQCNLRFTLAEVEHLRVAADEMGVSVSEYVRQRSLAGRVRPRVYHRGMNPALITELNSIGVAIKRLELEISREGNVINQLARKKHSDLSDDRFEQAIEEFRHLPDIVEQTHEQANQTLGAISSTLEQIIAGIASDDQ